MKYRLRNLTLNDIQLLGNEKSEMILFFFNLSLKMSTPKLTQLFHRKSHSLQQRKKVKAADAVKRRNLHNSSFLKRFRSNEEKARKVAMCQAINAPRADLPQWPRPGTAGPMLPSRDHYCLLLSLMALTTSNIHKEEKSREK